MQKCKDRLDAAAVYKRRNEGADPSPFLLSDFMTGLESEMETDNELEKIGISEIDRRFFTRRT